MEGGRDDTIRANLSSIIEAVVGVATIEDAVLLVRDRLGLEHVTYMAAAYARPVDSPFLRTTYPPQWIARYVVRGYLHVDPVVRAGFASTTPFFRARVGMERARASLHGRRAGPRPERQGL